MNNKKLEVVIDAANIIHVDVVNKEGHYSNTYVRSDLLNVFRICQSKGWKTVAILIDQCLFMEKYTWSVMFQY